MLVWPWAPRASTSASRCTRRPRSASRPGAVADPVRSIPWSIHIENPFGEVWEQKFQVEFIGSDNVRSAKRVFKLQKNDRSQTFEGILEASGDWRVGESVQVRVQFVHDDGLTDWYEPEPFRVGLLTCGTSVFTFDAQDLAETGAKAHERKLDTGIKLDETSRIRIRATGKITPLLQKHYHLVGGANDVGPEGTSAESKDGLLLPDANFGALLFTLAPDHKWERVTFDQIIDPTSSGTLWFTINTYVRNPKVGRELNNNLFWQPGGEFRVVVDHLSLSLPSGLGQQAERAAWTYAQGLFDPP